MTTEKEYEEVSPCCHATVYAGHCMHCKEPCEPVMIDEDGEEIENK